MQISVWYVYLSDAEEWLTDSRSGDSSDTITDAQEFHSEETAQKAAEHNDGVVLGWCQ